MQNKIELSQSFEGEIFTDTKMRLIYATDASAYREKPKIVAIPYNNKGVKQIIEYAHENKLSIIPRGAGTSLSGQVVGAGIIVDISKHFRNILEINTPKSYVRVQSRVILSELNQELAKHNLFFGPETSSANRCTIAGMVGNNACGLHSLIYGSTRDHILSVKTILSDGSEVEFKELTKDELTSKLKLQTLEGEIYRNIYEILSNPNNQKNIRKEFPDKSIPRRNTGYALDILLDTEPFSNSTNKFNLSKLIAGSEGTLSFITEITLNLIKLPPKEKAIICVHFHTLEESFKANLIALKYKPGAIELMDKNILDCTKDNINQRKNRFFIEGEPQAILMIEFARETKAEINEIAINLEKEMFDAGYGYKFPVIWGDDTKKVWDLRKSGLGVLSNIPGDAKPVSVVEDTAINVEKLPDYLSDFNKIMEHYNLKCVYHAHIGTGELHLRPLLNLKKQTDVELFRTVALEIAKLVKKYNGSLSGEHGDGRLRGEFIPLILGKQNYQLLKQIKQTWDRDNIFNPGKITDTPPMNTSLRYKPEQKIPEINTIFDFSETNGILRATEKCTGSGDCRKTEKIGGTMCPSYMATRDEQNSTRTRANILREYLTNSTKINKFNHKEIYQVMDLCLSCKACKSECPSGVDMTKLKAEFLQHYYEANHIPIRTLLVANITKINKIASFAPSIANLFFKKSFLSKFIMKIIGFSPQRQMPLLQKTTLKKWYKQHNNSKLSNKQKKVYLFNDEFTNYNDSDIGIKAILLLEQIGYKVVIPKHIESGRIYLSKGLLKKAKKIINTNIEFLKGKINSDTPLIGIEPSAILSFRDEYLYLVEKKLKNEAKIISENTFTIDEFLSKEIRSGKKISKYFTDAPQKIKFHGHCQQKSIANTGTVRDMLSIPKNYTVEEIPSGCCGMAGSFGYEREHYELSMKIGNQILFPEIRNTSEQIIIVASGTSCREQINDGTGVIASHPVEILYDAIKKK